MTSIHSRYHVPPLAQLKDDNTYIEYCMILNRLERDYGISRVAELAKPWRGLSNTEKLDKVKELDAELNKCYCTEAMVEVCAVCKADNRRRYGDEIPFGG